MALLSRGRMRTPPTLRSHRVASGCSDPLVFARVMSGWKDSIQSSTQLFPRHRKLDLQLGILLIPLKCLFDDHRG